MKKYIKLFEEYINKYTYTELSGHSYTRNFSGIVGVKGDDNVIYTYIVTFSGGVNPQYNICYRLVAESDLKKFASDVAENTAKSDYMFKERKGDMPFWEQLPEDERVNRIDVAYKSELADLTYKHTHSLFTLDVSNELYYGKYSSDYFIEIENIMTQQFFIIDYKLLRYMANLDIKKDSTDYMRVDSKVQGISEDKESIITLMMYLDGNYECYNMQKKYTKRIGQEILDDNAISDEYKEKMIKFCINNGIDIGVSDDVKDIANAAMKGNHKLR